MPWNGIQLIDTRLYFQMGLLSPLPNSQWLLADGRQFEKWKIPRTLTPNLCSSSDSIRRSHGKLNWSIYTQRVRERTLGNQRVLILAIFLFTFFLQFGLFQKWLCHIRRFVLEARCAPILHQGFALARSRICWALESKIENDGLWYDWFMYQTYRCFFPKPFEKRHTPQSYRLHCSNWDMCYDQRRHWCQKPII